MKFELDDFHKSVISLVTIWEKALLDDNPKFG